MLQARQQIKEEFGGRRTQFKAAGNNPLKFTLDVNEALANLLVKRNAAYLGPVEAFEEAFEDLRHHQLAMLAGMRVAFESMLAQLDPDHLQKAFDRQLRKRPLAMVPAKLRYWDLYCETRQAMAKDPEATFNTLFGAAFANAYEAQLERLKFESRAAKA